MIQLHSSLEQLLGELCEVLDEQIALLTTRDEQVSQMCDGMLQRDFDEIDRLLEAVDQTQARQQVNDERVKSVRARLARDLHWTVDELQMSRLIDELPQEWAEAIDNRRERILRLARELKKRNVASSTLLYECARINRNLLECIFPQLGLVDTYQPGGTEHWRSDHSLVSSSG
jgi:flagellar biosynthesis/type III secretory pathway chaperone